MKQLLIVKNNKVFTPTPNTDGEITNLVNSGTLMADGQLYIGGLPNGNKYIALGRGDKSTPIIIPEVDINTLTVTKASYTVGTKFKRIITIPTIASTDVGKTYGIALVKKGTVPHERNTWSFTQYIDENSTDVKIATAIKDGIEANLGDKFNVTQGVTSSTPSALTGELTIEAKTFGEGWELVLLEDLYGNSTVVTPNTSSVSTNYVDGKPAIGDAIYVKELASKCAAGKGFTDTYADGATVYKGYPESVPDDGTYDIYTLRFAVGRDAAKTRDERVNQIVHIAVPTTYTSVETAISNNLTSVSLSGRNAAPRDADMTGNGE